MGREANVAAEQEGFVMESVVGIFTTCSEADKAIARLESSGIAGTHINFLVPGNSEQQIKNVPVTETEPYGPGEAIGGAVGGALGAAGGMGLATMFLPGIGPILVVGILGASILGAVGAIGGAAAGKALETNMAEGIAVDELFFYEDALRQGRAIVIVLIEDDKQGRIARKVMEEAGAESIDLARENWWIGLRAAEKERFTAQDRTAEWNESYYRRGFEAALRPGARGKSYEEIAEDLAASYPDAHSRESFRCGYDRGQSYYRSLPRKEKNSYSATAKEQ